jgi:hypothetical protein
VNDQSQPILSLHDTAVRVGVTTDTLRRRMKSDPVLLACFTKLGKVYAAPVTKLDTIRERLGLGPAVRA